MEFRLLKSCVTIPTQQSQYILLVSSTVPLEIAIIQFLVMFVVFRNLEHSTILYEDPKQLPLLRLSWNKQDPNYLATLALESSEVGGANAMGNVVGGYLTEINR